MTRKSKGVGKMPEGGHNSYHHSWPHTELHRRERREQKETRFLFFTSIKLSWGYAWAIVTLAVESLQIQLFTIITHCRYWQFNGCLKVSELFYLSDKILVIDHAKVPACSLGDPLPCHQVTHHDGCRAYTDCKKNVVERWAMGFFCCSDEYLHSNCVMCRLFYDICWTLLKPRPS